MARSEEITLHTSGAETADGNSEDFENFQNYEQAVFYLDVTAVSGTSPTLDVTIEEKDPVSGKYFTIGTFAQKTATGSERIVINPLYGTILRAKWVIGGTSPSFTFSLSAVCKSVE